MWWLSDKIKSPFMGKLNSGGDDPTPLFPKQMKDWNKYVDFIKTKGYQGSKELDKKETGLAKSLLDEFIKLNPDTSINHDTVKSVQMEMQKLKKSAQGFAERRNDPNAKNIMSDISNVDGWPGSKTTQFKFPEMMEKRFVDNNLVSQMNLGLVGGGLNPTAKATSVLPKGAKLEKMSDGKLYYQDAAGDYKLYK